jgi:chemosensory pili system protein ChpA (sensor histidine kinase/response regulator)
MITSRTGDKHRDHALSLGVDRFLGKPYQESELLDEISSVLTERRG